MNSRVWSLIVLCLQSIYCYAYVYRVITVRSGSWNGAGPARIVLLFDYHEPDTVDVAQRAGLLEYLLPKYGSPRALVVEDLHSKNSMGSQGFGQFELQQRGDGLMAGLAALVDAHGGAVSNVEYRYARVIGLAQSLAYPYIEPHTFKPARIITVQDIRNEVQQAVNAIFRAQIPDPLVRRLCQEMATRGICELDVCSSGIQKYSLAQFCCSFLPGAERANGIKRLLKADSQVLEGLLLLALFSFATTTREVVVLAGGAHCAALAMQLLHMGYQQELFVHDIRSMYSKKPPPVNGDFFKLLS